MKILKMLSLAMLLSFVFTSCENNETVTAIDDETTTEAVAAKDANCILDLTFARNNCPGNNACGFVEARIQDRGCLACSAYPNYNKNNVREGYFFQQRGRIFVIENGKKKYLAKCN